MYLSRRFLLHAGMASLLSGCMNGGLPAPRAEAGPATDPGLVPHPNAGYDAWVRAFRDRAQARGIAPATLSAAFRGAGYLPGVIERDRRQTEFTRTLQDYFAIMASEERVATVRARFAAQRGTLSRIEGRYGVPAHVVAAIWGVESRYGERRGDIPVISACSTLAYDGRRGDFFEKQLMAALKILQRGDVPASRMTGSWAGAMGHTQFIPTTFEAYAVDFTGDGRRDIWGEDPTDALASTAAYLGRSGWRQGGLWGLEVRLPGGFSSGLTGRGVKKSAGDWAALGVSAAAGGSLPDHGPGSILAPSGTGGPAFLVFRNFSTILRYNNSENYALGVGYLSDRLAGAGPLRGQFGPDEYGLTIADRKRMQERLTAAGYDTGGADGVFGKKTEAAISAYQQANGLPVTGAPSQDLLNRLR